MLRSSLLIGLLAFSAAASADGFSYNYLTLGYGNVEIFDADGDGFNLGGSYAFSDNIHGFLGYETGELESIVDATRIRAGIGYNTGLTDALDMYARLSYESIDLDVPAILVPILGLGDSDESGYGVGIGGRFRATDQLELNGGIKHVDYGDFDETSLEIGGVYSFNDKWSLGLQGDFGDDISTYALSGRFYFGK